LKAGHKQNGSREDRKFQKQKSYYFQSPWEVNTDDLSPASCAGSRADIPLHALYMLENRYPGALGEIRELKKKGYPIAFVADVLEQEAAGNPQPIPLSGG